jgi:hypothetical protein
VSSAALLLLLAGCGLLPPVGQAAGGPLTGVLDDAAAEEAIAGAPPGSALASLGELDVRGRAPRTGYEREEFGYGWADTDHNGCDTRNDVLARDLTGESFRSGSDCVVVSGTLEDPYSGHTIDFRRGEGTSDDVQIDHVVALSDAWQKGAQRWDDDRRTAFANDPLIPVRLRRTAGRGEERLRAVGHPRRAQRRGDGAHRLPGRAAAWRPAGRPRPGGTRTDRHLLRRLRRRPRGGRGPDPARRARLERHLRRGRRRARLRVGVPAPAR